MEKTYIVRNLDCAHCGGLIEEAISKIEGIDSAVLIFPTRKLKVSGSLSDDMLRRMNKTASSIEDGVVIAEAEENDDDGGKSFKLQLVLLIIGVIIFALAVIAGDTLGNPLKILLYVTAYLLLGYDILLATFRNLAKGRIFDENFLMAVATAGAFILGEFSEAVGVVLFFRIGEIFESYAVNRSRKAITALAELKVDEAEVLRGGEFVSLPSEDIVVGDIMRIKVGESLAADGVVESGETRIDTSAITGEPVPVLAKVGDSIVSGCINLSSVITVRATASAGESAIAKIAEAIENASASKPEIDRFITRFAKVYTPIVIAVAFITAIIPSLITGEWDKWIYSALTFLVISCPCALVLSVPLAYFSGIGAASKMGILFKGGNTIEALARVKAVAFDKTGTLTNGTFSVTEICSYGKMTETELLSLCAGCESVSSHPVALSIVKHCGDEGISCESPDSAEELSGRGVLAVIGGKNVLCGNARLMAENGVSLPESSEAAGSIVYVAVDGQAEGRILVSDSIRPTASCAVKALEAMGITSAMLTGDNSENARITAEKLGIQRERGGLLPEDKLHELSELRNEYGAVMFVGDGINDGPVLAAADVGGAMQSGSDLALEAADIVFMNNDPESVVFAKKTADRTLKISYQNIIFALAVKAAVLLLGILGHPSMWFAVFADSGTAMLLILNSIRILNTRKLFRKTE